jgi:predicted DNA-binding transcriptional regulator AlpA
VTTEELLAVTRSSRDTLYEWVAKRLLPRPSITTGAGGEQFAVWPAEALERVRFIVGKTREGLAMDEIAALAEARWRRR